MLSPKLDGDNRPPLEQRDLSAADIREKEYAVFDKALTDLECYWQDTKFDNFDVVTERIPCGDDPLKWDDLENVKRFFKAPLRDIHQFSELSNECKRMFRHLDRHLNEIVFVRCNDRSCCSEWQSDNLQRYLQAFDFRFPAPTFDVIHEGHYDTFLQRSIKQIRLTNDSEFNFADDGQPLATKAALGSCSFCPMFRFKSKTERERHVGMFHRRQKKRSSEVTKKNTSAPEKRPVPEKRPSSQRKKQRQRSIHDMLRQYPNNDDVSDDSDSDEENCSTFCKIRDFKNVVITWISCDTCASWYHSHCVDLGRLSQPEIERLKYICTKCKE